MKLFIFKTYSVGHPNQRICGSNENECITNIFAALYDEFSVTFKTCDCLPDCTSLSYSHEVIVDKISSEYLKNNYESNGTFNLEGEALVFFGDSEYIGYRRFARVDIGSFLAKVGGLLSFFFGVSLLSLVEIIYFFTLRFTNNLWFLK